MRQQLHEGSGVGICARNTPARRVTFGNLVNPKPRGTFEGLAINHGIRQGTSAKPPTLSVTSGRTEAITKKDFEPKTISLPDVEGAA